MLLVNSLCQYPANPPGPGTPSDEAFPSEDYSMSGFFGADKNEDVQERQALLLGGILSMDKSVRNPEALAKNMLGAHGSLAILLTKPVEDIAQLPGVSSRQAHLVKASYKALVDCVFAQIKDRPYLDYDALIAMALWTIGQSATEKVLIFFLNKQDRVIGMETLCSGSEAFVSVSVRTVIAAACRKNANSLIIAHNHPGGSTTPSQHDFDFMDDLLLAMALMQMSLVDSLIVSGNSWYSFREAGRL